MKFSLLIGLLLQLFSPVNKEDIHAIYISVIEIDLTSEAQDVNMFIKVFSDDLENAIRNSSGQILSIQYQTPSDRELDAIEKYYAEHISIRLDDAEVDIVLKNVTLENDTHWIEFSFPYSREEKQLELYADFFMEIFPSQSQMVQLKNGNKTQFGRLSKKQPKKSFTL